MKQEYTIIIEKQKSLLNRDLAIYKHDKGIDVYFKLMNNPYIDLSKNKYLLSDVVLVSPLKREIVSDVVPIVDNKILFTISNKIMNQIDEIGNYHVHIRIYDDKGGRLKLPHFNMRVQECEFKDSGLEYTVLNKSAIDNSKVSLYGEELATFNIDGSYNRTIWVAGDIITDTKLNKLEQATSEIVDEILNTKEKLKELDKSKGYIFKKGTNESPVIIEDLEKGSYILQGYVQDFSTTEPYLLEDEKNFLYVTYNGSKYNLVYRCFNEESFKKCYYDKHTKEIIPALDELYVINVEDNKLNLTNDKYQFLNVDGTSNVVLPTIANDFIEINLFIKPSSDKCTLIFPNLVWKNQPTLGKDILCKITLQYIDDAWYGNSVNYAEDIELIEYTDSEIDEIWGGEY